MTADRPEAWQQTGSPPTLEANQVHAWVFTLDSSADTDHEILDPRELARCKAIADEQQRRYYARAHVICRQILSCYLGLSPRDIQFRQQPSGKPFIANTDVIEFSLSHSGSTALLAVAKAPVGIDIEQENRKTGGLKLAKRFFSQQEHEQLAATATQDQARAFLQTWTRKEAVVKCHGGGIVSGLNAFSTLETGPHLVKADTGNGPATFFCRNLPGPEQHISAVAVQLTNPDTRLFRYKL